MPYGLSADSAYIPPFFVLAKSPLVVNVIVQTSANNNVSTL